MNDFSSKINTEQKYSVISATYNVEKYLDDYFRSLIKQTLDFEKYIHIYMVDDGSTDKSAYIVKKWQNLYPNNISYIKKENAGQASARNFGLEYLHTPWVTFIDSDDFIDKQYFEKVDETIKKYQYSDLAMIGCNIQYYFEKLRLYLDRHPLRYRFKSENTNYIIKDLNKNIQLSASAAFFRTDLIKATQLKFDTRIKPNFEDVHFVNSYLIENHLSTVSFLKDAKYYYRRRKIKNSTLDSVWTKSELYNEVLYFGCLDLFEKADKKFGFIPEFLQRTILYHLSWYYKYIVDHPEFIGFLTSEQQETFKTLLGKNFEYIDVETIAAFDLSGIDDFIKQGWVNFYKQASLPYYTVHIYKENKNLQLQYFAKAPESLHIQIDDMTISMPDLHVTEHTFMDANFINEYKFEFPFTKRMKTISIHIGSYPTYLKTANKHSLKQIEVSSIKSISMLRIKKILYNLVRKIVLGN